MTDRYLKKTVYYDRFGRLVSSETEEIDALPADNPPVSPTTDRDLYLLTREWERLISQVDFWDWLLKVEGNAQRYLRAMTASIVARTSHIANDPDGCRRALYDAYIHASQELSSIQAHNREAQMRKRLASRQGTCMGTSHTQLRRPLPTQEPSK